MQLSNPMLFAGLWVYGFLVYFLFFKLFVWFAYSGASPQIAVTHPLVGAGLGVLGGFYFALTLHGLRPQATSKSGSSIMVSGGCVAILAAFLTFATVTVLSALYLVFFSGREFSSPFHAFLLACTSFGVAVFSVWFLYSIPFNFAFGTLAGKLLSWLRR
jgi:hypothetical protein